MLTVGNPDEWKDFEKRHRAFLERYDELRDAQNIAFIRPLVEPNRRDLVVFYSGRLAVEDFNEILLLAANGNGVAALKILRGMYERLVHGRYLSKAPDAEVDNFYDWHWVQKHKLVEELTKTMGPDFFTELGYEDGANNIREQCQAVRERFLVKHCDHCKKQKPNHTWSKLSLLEMAASAGEGVRAVTFESYYIPLEHTHSSIAAILHRLKEDENRAITFKHDAQRSEADAALRYAHLLLINILDLQQDHFSLEQLKHPLEKCMATYREIWLPEEATDASGAGLTSV